MHNMPYGVVLPGQKILEAPKVNMLQKAKTLKIKNGGKDLVELQSTKEQFDTEFSENIKSFSANIAFLESQNKRVGQILT